MRNSVLCAARDLARASYRRPLAYRNKAHSLPWSSREWGSDNTLLRRHNAFVRPALTRCLTPHAAVRMSCMAVSSSSSSRRRGMRKRASVVADNSCAADELPATTSPPPRAAPAAHPRTAIPPPTIPNTSTSNPPPPSTAARCTADVLSPTQPRRRRGGRPRRRMRTRSDRDEVSATEEPRVMDAADTAMQTAKDSGTELRHRSELPTGQSAVSAVEFAAPRCGGGTESVPQRAARAKGPTGPRAASPQASTTHTNKKSSVGGTTSCDGGASGTKRSGVGNPNVHELGKPPRTQAASVMAAHLPRSASARIREHIRRKRILLQRQKQQQQQQQQPVQPAAPSSSVAKSTRQIEQRPHLRTPSRDVGGNSPETRSTTRTPSLLFFPDHRERVLTMFDQLAQINLALGERYKAQSYQSAVERLKRGDAIFRILPPNLVPVSPADYAQADAAKAQQVLAQRAFMSSPANAIPGVGDKLRRKIIEILKTGDLAELHVLEAKPIIRAIRELTQVHGFGPRTAVNLYKNHGISTIAQLKAYAAEHDRAGVGVAVTGAKASSATGAKAFRLTDAQRTGLKYHDEIVQRIPHSEGRLHEAFLKTRLRKYLGKDYVLTVCGSFRRGVPESGDIDVLLTRRAEATTDVTPAGQEPHSLLRHFIDALRSERYIEASLAQGPTKFMGVCRLCSDGRTAVPPRRFPARRIDVRYVDAASFPAALLYFTGSKNFNVVMRAEAIKQNYVLNEYGLFRNHSPHDAQDTTKLHDMISRLARAQFSPLEGVALAVHDAKDESAAGDVPALTAGTPREESSDGRKAGKRRSAASSATVTPKQLRELKELARKVEALRVKVRSEEDIFDALKMSYVAPTDRNL